MKQKKIFTISAFILAFAIGIALLDAHVLKSDGFGLTFGVGAVLIIIVFPVAVILTTLFGTGKIAVSLASSKVTANEKKDMLKRLLIVIVVALAVMGLFGLLNAIGTKLIDI